MKVLALATLLAVGACAPDEKLSDLPAQATAQVQRWVPVGTSQTDALRIMEQHHFACYLTNADSLSFDYRIPNSRITPTVYHMWMAKLTLDSGRVSEVMVKTGLKGL